MHLKAFEKREQNKFKISRWEEIIKIWTQVNVIKQKTVERIGEIKS